MGGFFRMDRGDLATVVFLVAYAALAFSLIGSESRWAGVSPFGWAMAAFMFLAPLVHLLLGR